MLQYEAGDIILANKESMAQDNPVLETAWLLI
jgi:hypothetical protein